MSRYITILAAVLTVGCAGQPIPDMDVDGVGVKDETGALLVDPTFPARFQAETEAGLKYAGGSWKDLKGWVVVFEAANSVTCDSGHSDAIRGCTSSASRVVRIAAAPMDGGSCIANSSLMHELVHVVIGDHCHRSPLFQDFLSLSREVDALESGRQAVCRPVVSWRESPSC